MDVLTDVPGALEPKERISVHRELTLPWRYDIAANEQESTFDSLPSAQSGEEEKLADFQEWRVALTPSITPMMINEAPSNSKKRGNWASTTAT
jgi:hypothetical protein